MLAADLKVDQFALTDDFPWLDEMGVEDASYFLAKLNDEFTRLPPGASFGSGARPFPPHIDAQLMRRIATVGSLIEFVERDRAGAP
jgi:hypothetical protein